MLYSLRLALRNASIRFLSVRSVLGARLTFPDHQRFPAVSSSFRTPAFQICTLRLSLHSQAGARAGRRHRLRLLVDAGTVKRSTLRIDRGTFGVKRAIFRAVEIGFTARQVVQLTGIPYSTLNLWAKNGLVEPSVAPGTGTGSERVYSFADLVALKVAFELRKSGVTTSSLKKIVAFLRRNTHLDKPLSQARLVVRGHDVAIVREGELVSVLSKPGQGYLSFVVDLPQVLGTLVNIADATKTFAHALASAEGKRPPNSVSGGSQRKRSGK